MKVTRRSLAKIAVAGSAAQLLASQQAKAQTPSSANNTLDAARAEYRGAAQAMASVKVPRTTEPVTRFEA